ncbi:MAG TPA: hypothetical protein VFG88_07080 [Nocardioidaceae bacterium]|nr:hypothetical protein [Nocardioidaceae bacterium]
MNFELNAYLVHTEQRRHPHRTSRRVTAESSARPRSLTRLQRHRRH